MNRALTAAIVFAYTAALLLIAAVRSSAGSDGLLTPLAPYATLLYVGAVVLALNALPRAGVDFDRFGFSLLRWRHLLLGLSGVIVIQVAAWVLGPLWESLFSTARDLSRFAALAGSPTELARLLALSWTFAAFGEELAFRILLLRGLVTVLGNGRGALVTAVALQAAVFAATHAYQGPEGMLETFTSGLVYGAITVLGGFAIWPAALAHGMGNTIGLLRLYFTS